jgi:hypothetical protein
MKIIVTLFASIILGTCSSPSPSPVKTPTPTPVKVRTLTWNPNPATELVKSYNVYGGSAIMVVQGTFCQVKAVSGQTFTVNAVNQAGEGPPSNKVTSP